MKKFIAAFDALKPSESTLDYAIDLAKKSNAFLTGIFLSESTRLSYALYEMILGQSLSGQAIVNEIDKNDAKLFDSSISSFETSCEASRVSYSVRRDTKHAVNQLLHETVFADLLIIDTSDSFSYLDAQVPGAFLKNTLHNAQCPVLAVPKYFEEVNGLVLLYDGSPSSVQSIKMLDFTLPELGALPVTVFHAKGNDTYSHLPDEELAKDWISRHYPQAVYNIIQGNEQDLTGMLAGVYQGSLIATGSYERSSLSMWLRRSLADHLMQGINAPLFIAH